MIIFSKKELKEYVKNITTPEGDISLWTTEKIKLFRRLSYRELNNHIKECEFFIQKYTYLIEKDAELALFNSISSIMPLLITITVTIFVSLIANTFLGIDSLLQLESNPVLYASLLEESILSNTNLFHDLFVETLKLFLLMSAGIGVLHFFRIKRNKNYFYCLQYYKEMLKLLRIAKKQKDKKIKKKHV